MYFHGFTPVEFVRGEDRITQHASGWRVNGSGHLERAKDAMALVEQAPAEEWRQVYCGINLFLVSDRGEVKKHDGTPADTVPERPLPGQVPGREVRPPARPRDLPLAPGGHGVP